MLGALLTIAVSAAPVLELRGGIPLALARGFGPAWSLVLALAGNLAIIPVLLWGFQWGEKILNHWPPTRRALSWIFARSRRRGTWVERFGPIGLILVVALPLPGTGAWTGAIVARLLGIDNRWALLWIALGVVIAGGLVTAASLGVLTWFAVPQAP